jgi:DNA-binding beta-propeller fold protein YncE
MADSISRRTALGRLAGATACAALSGTGARAASGSRRLLYVAAPGIRDYLDYGGHGLLVFDVDDGHEFVRRIPLRGLSPEGKPLNVKGVCASAATGRIYVSTTKQLQCLDLRTDEFLWERAYEVGCDRMSITPDGKEIYLPSFEGDIWQVIDAADGAVLAVIEPRSGAHNTVVGLDGREAYLAGLRSPHLTVVDTARREATRTVGPFSAAIRPFTVNGRQTRIYANINELLGFEVGDLKSGKVLHRVEVPGHAKGPIKRHGCPSHGVALTPDEAEVWVCDAHNQKLHVFDARGEPPVYRASIALKDEPGWITFSRDGDYAYPSTGQVIDPRTRAIVAELVDETGAAVQSEKMVEVTFVDGGPRRVGDQFGLGRIGAPDGIAP